VSYGVQKEVVYGLTEILREDIKKARLVANPGCYPTTIQLPLVPLLKVCFSILFWYAILLNCLVFRLSTQCVDFGAGKSHQT